MGCAYGTITKAGVGDVAAGRDRTLLSQVLWGVAVGLTVVAVMLAAFGFVWPSVYHDVAWRLDQVRGEAIVHLWDTEPYLPVTREAMDARDDLKRVLATAPEWECDMPRDASVSEAMGMCVRDAVLEARVRRALAAYEAHVPAQRYAHREDVDQAPAWRSVSQAVVGEELADAAHEQGALVAYSDNLFGAHRWGEAGKRIYRLQPGDDVVLDGRTLVIDAEVYGHEGALTPSELTDQGKVVLCTCIDTDGAAGSPVEYKVGHWM